MVIFGALSTARRRPDVVLLSPCLTPGGRAQNPLRLRSQVRYAYGVFRFLPGYASALS